MKRRPGHQKYFPNSPGSPPEKSSQLSRRNTHKALASIPGNPSTQHIAAVGSMYKAAPKPALPVKLYWRCQIRPASGIRARTWSQERVFHSLWDIPLELVIKGTLCFVLWSTNSDNLFAGGINSPSQTFTRRPW